jgi:integrase
MAQTRKLTPISVANAKAADKRREISDGGSGLWLVVQPSGKKSWALRYRFNRRPKKLTLKASSLADARRQAATALHEVEQGRDPAARVLAEKRVRAERGLDTVDRLLAEFLERYAKRRWRPSSWRLCEGAFRREVLPAWSGRTVHDIAKRDVVRLVERMAEKHPVSANRALGHLRVFFNWLIDQDIISVSPCHRVKPPAEEYPRDRVLTDEEIRRLWSACDQVGDPFGTFVKTLLLTGQRRSEVGGLRWHEIDEDGCWTLAPERNKAGRVHVVPLPAQVRAILAGFPRIGDYVFTSTGIVGVSGYSHGKRHIDQCMAGVPPWKLHDLRRTCASGLQKLGLPIHITEAVLNHRGGTLGGIVRIYQTHDYFAEKANALQRWADHVDTIVRGEPAGKVVPLRSRP